MSLIDVTHVSALPNRKLELVFEDGLHAVVEMDRLVQSYTGVLAPLLDDDYFKLVKVAPELGTIVWPSGADVCPAVLYSHASGKPIGMATHPVNAPAAPVRAAQ